jgi:regulator of sigma E protease
VLDGGHLFFFLLEAIIRRPLELKHRERAQQVGMVLLILVMIYAFYNDIARFFEG